MPSFIIAQASGRSGEVNAVICEPNIATGYPDHQSAVPVSVRFVSEQMLCVDDQPRRIISSVTENGKATILINGSARGLRNRERRAALARASSLLQQLGATLRPLQAESGAPEHITEALGLLWNWLSDEREAATAAPRPETTSSHDEVSK